MFWVGLVIGWAIGGLVTVAVLALFMKGQLGPFVS